MADPEPLESFLVADCGRTNTKVGLVDQINGATRFVAAAFAPTTLEPPTADIGAGIRRAIELLQARTERKFLSDDDQLVIPERASGQGVDGFCAITSAALPLRVAIVGLSREVSVASAARAIQSTYATIDATLALDETGGRWIQMPAPAPNGNKKQIAPMMDPQVIAAETLARANADVIVFVGGIDGGATTALYEIANLVAVTAAAQDESTRPAILFAGNRDARPQIAARIGQIAQLRVTDNVHPALERENLAPLQRELETLYEERQLARLPGIGALGNWTTAKILPSARAFENVVRFLARRYGLNILAADIGSATTTIAQTRGDAYTRVVRADLGIGSSLQAMLARAGTHALMQWIPLEMDADDMLATWLNHAIHPGAIPGTRDEFLLLQAAARVALTSAARNAQLDARAVDLLLLTGGIFSNNSNFASLALLALDGLQPSGIFTLAVDQFGLAPAYGALAALNAAAAGDVIERDGFTTLGTVIAPLSNNRAGAVDVRIQVQPTNGGAMNIEVPHGSLEVIPLPAGQKAAIQVRASTGVLLGAGRGSTFKAEIEGGVLGLIVDARSRPIQLPDQPEKRRVQVQEWLWDVGA